MTATPRYHRISRGIAFGATLALSAPSMAANEALMDLFKLLRDKGTLNQQEYELLVNAAKADEEKVEYRHEEVKKEVKEEVAKVEQKTEAQVAKVEQKTSALGWAEKVKLKGDMRTRYQYEDTDGQGSRSRGRLRYRLGVIATPTDGWEVGAGMASGSGDPRSTNQSFDDTFSKKSLNLDYAYMQYAFGNGFKAVAGKFLFKDYLYTASDVMWDTDITPEGFSVNYTGPNAFGTWFANTGIWVLEENAHSSNDPYMPYGQIGQNWKSGDWNGTVAFSGFMFADITKPSDISRSGGTNTDADLSSVNLSGEISHPLGGGTATLFGDYVQNVETSTSQDTAWSVGAKYLYGKWSFRYIYADVEANGVPDFLPDSDRFDGLTGIYGHEWEVHYALLEKVSLGLDFYHASENITDIDQNLLQVDVEVKF